MSDSSCFRSSPRAIAPLTHESDASGKPTAGTRPYASSGGEQIANCCFINAARPFPLPQAQNQPVAKLHGTGEGRERQQEAGEIPPAPVGKRNPIFGGNVWGFFEGGGCPKG